MSSARFAIPFRVVLRRSFLLVSALLFMHGGALLWLFSFALPLWFKLTAAAVTAISLLLQLRLHLLQKGRGAVIALEWDGGEEWRLQLAEGGYITARLLGSSFVTAWLIVLNFKPEAGCRRMLPVIIMTDTIDTSSFRRLTSKLRRAAGRVAEPLI